MVPSHQQPVIAACLMLDARFFSFANLSLSLSPRLPLATFVCFESAHVFENFYGAVHNVFIANSGALECGLYKLKVPPGL